MRHAELPISLEQKLDHLAIVNVDVKQKINFIDYLKQNEENVTTIKTHLDKIKIWGLIVSTGAERSFFDLALADPDLCYGLVVRDINPRVKAYIDFNVMLLRLSNNRKTYEAISSPINPIEYNTRKKLIKTMLQEDDQIPQGVKRYYENHLDDFFNIYFDNNKWQNSPAYEGVKYQLDDILFSRLQTAARNGNIIATIGSINDLSFLDEFNIAAVDVSNTPDYIILDIQTKNLPRIIWVHGQRQNTKFFSYQHEPLDKINREKFEQFLNKYYVKEMIDKLQGLGGFLGNPFRMLLTFNREYDDKFTQNLLRHPDNNYYLATYTTQIIPVLEKIDAQIDEDPFSYWSYFGDILQSISGFDWLIKQAHKTWQSAKKNREADQSQVALFEYEKAIKLYNMVHNDKAYENNTDFNQICKMLNDEYKNYHLHITENANNKIKIENSSIFKKPTDLSIRTVEALNLYIMNEHDQDKVEAAHIMISFLKKINTPTTITEKHISLLKTGQLGEIISKNNEALDFVANLEKKLKVDFKSK